MPQKVDCTISGISFEISDLEINLRKKLRAAMPEKLPKFLFRELNAFWWHFGLHKRKCDGTGEEIISVFDENCPYPVWHRDYWTKNANPPSIDYDSSQPFFSQLWKLFQQCPIPHNIGTGNENCDYTDDWWYGKNCYLCHSGFKCEDISYCYRVISLRDCQFCVFSFESELCCDLIYSFNCYNVRYALFSRNCRDSSFLFDCHNCHNCLYCWNLRNKEYCIANIQYTKEAYEQKIKEFSLSKRSNYESAKKQFHQLITTKAWWKASYIEKCENVTGDFLENSKNTLNCYFTQEQHDCVNSMRGYGNKDCVDVAGSFNTELGYYSSMPQDHSYDIRFCYNVMNCKFLEYSAHCLNCENCFACCGLVGKKFCILNKEYSEAEYKKKKEEILSHLQKRGEYGSFFPGYFAANPYDESLSAFYWPLTKEDQEKNGFRVTTKMKREVSPEYQSVSVIPDDSMNISDDITTKVYWDEQESLPFQISKKDVLFAQKLHAPLPYTNYIRRMKENFRWIPFSGEMRETTCAKTGETIMTSLPSSLDGRILSEEAYLKEVY